MTAIGIDLGTTNSRIAFNTSAPHEIPVFDLLQNEYTGKTSTPTMVSFLDDSILIGEEARKVYANKPENAIYGIKRMLGRKYYEIEKLFKNSPFKISYDNEGWPIVEVIQNNKVEYYTPEEMMSFIFGELNNMVTARAGKEKTCVITVPAKSTSSQRAAMKRVAEISGFKVLKLVTEPVAAAVYALHQAPFTNGTLLCCYFGASTLDICVMEIKNDKTITVKSIAGDISLGGSEIDRYIMNEMLNRFEEKHPDMDPTTSNRSLALLRQACEEAKIFLSDRLEVQVKIDDFFEGIPLDEKLTRDDLKEICSENIFCNINDQIDLAIGEAKLTAKDINQILICGMSKTPWICYDVIRYFNGRITPMAIADSNGCIAIGACMICHDLMTEKQLVINDVLPYSVGFLENRQNVKMLIDRNAPLPQERSFEFVVKNPTLKACIQFFQGDNDEVRNNAPIGKFMLDDIPIIPNSKFTMKVEVAEDGILSVSAFFVQDGRKDIMALRSATRLEGEEMERTIKRHNMIMAQRMIKELQRRIIRHRKLADMYEEIVKLGPNDLELLRVMFANTKDE